MTSERKGGGALLVQTRRWVKGRVCSRKILLRVLFWNLMSSCKTAGWKRRPGRERGAMLVGGASRGGGGEADETGEREGKAEVKKTGTQTFAAGSEENRSKTHRQTHTRARTATPCLVGRSPEPRGYFHRPPGGRGSSGRAPGRRASSHLALKVLFSSLLGYRPRCSGPCR